MLSTSSPPALRTSNNPKTIFDLELLELDIDFVVTLYANKTPGIELVGSDRVPCSNVLHAVSRTYLSIPSDGSFVIQLGSGNFDCLEHLVYTVPFDIIVPDIGFQYGFQLLCRSSGPLIDDCLLNELIA